MIVFDAADVQVSGGADDEGIASGLSLADIGELAVVHDVAVLHRIDHGGVVAHGEADDRHHGVGLFDIVRGAGEDDHVALIALVLHEFEGDRVRHAAVQELFAADLHDAGDHGHGAGGTEPFQQFPLILLFAVTEVVDGLPGLGIGADQIKFHGIFPEGLPVKGIQLFRDVVVTELGVKEVARGDEGPDARIAGVLCEPQVVADGAPVLAGFVVAAEGRARGYADPAVKSYALFHENIDNTS